jgi:hypothetical protein
MSATGTGTSGHFIPKLLEDALGAKFNVVMGYRAAPSRILRSRGVRVVLPFVSIPPFLRASHF